MLSKIPQNDRSFKCYCCKRTLIYEAKYQCLICEVTYLFNRAQDIEVCKICFGSNYHECHDFIVRPSPDKEWEPAFRQPIQQSSEDYMKLAEDLKTRDLRADDYQKLLTSEARSALLTLPKYLALVFDKTYPSTSKIAQSNILYCA